MTDSDVVLDGTDSSNQGDLGVRRRRWFVPIIVIVALLLLLCGCVVASELLLVSGSARTRFVVRNLECLQCHTDKIPDLGRPSVHNPFALKQCTTCHTSHGEEVTTIVAHSPQRLAKRYMTLLVWMPFRWWLTLSRASASEALTTSGVAADTSVRVGAGASNLVVPEAELCWTCHGSMGAKLADTFQHQPFASGHCTGCHDPHASDHGVLLTQEVDEICFTCHAVGGELRRAQSHPPAKKGQCIDCHEPHASNFKGILVAGQRTLCFSCHPTVAGQSGKPVQHAPFVNDNCTGCHEPHGSDHRPLLTAEQPDVCYGCHGGIQNQFAQRSRHPVGLSMQCGTCHDPHASQYSGLVVAGDSSNRFCFGCHAQIRPSFASSEHRNQLCIGCHTPHGSAFSPMLLERNPDVCFRCHPRDSYDAQVNGGPSRGHPVRPNYYDVNNESPLTCTSSCHNPHGTGKKRMLRYFSSTQDGGCLMCHAVTSLARVGIAY